MSQRGTDRSGVGRPYDSSSIESIYEFARKLTGKSLAEVVYIPSHFVNPRNRGDLGSLVEAFYFERKAGSDIGPDFSEAGLELKTTGVIRDKRGGYIAKERLVLTMINYQDIVLEDWETSSLLNKCSVMLILFYLFDSRIPVVDRRFVLNPLLYRMLEEDIFEIQRDWQLIKNKVADGKAHELSEGDTFYLSACRKGTGGPSEKLRRQPFSEVDAKSRAFSLKASYMTRLIARSQSDDETKIRLSATTPLEEATALRFSNFLGRTVLDISTDLSYFKESANQKGFHRSLALRMLTGGSQLPVELAKAGVEMKTIRVDSMGRAREAMSFPTFNYLRLINEVWEESSFFEKIERKFLFVVYQTGADGVERLWKVSYWNMPFQDRLEAEAVWRATKFCVLQKNPQLPKSSENPVAHVRPKAKNALDTLPTPHGDFWVRSAFWLNRTYITDVLKAL